MNVFFQFASNFAMKQASQSHLHVFVRWKSSLHRKRKLL